ncbi:MAG: glutathione synthase [Sphingomonadaceae bacterium]
MVKPLSVAVQMDALEQINIAGDSTFALMLSAQARGHRLWHYLPGDLDWVDGRIMVTARPVEVFRPGAEGQPYFRWLADAEYVEMASEIDVVLMRQDPPFDIAYITATHLLEHAQKAGVLVVNDPAAVRNAPEKLLVLNYADCMPPTLVTRSLAAAEAFRASHGEIVLKPLHGHGGAAIFHIGGKDPNLSALVELFGKVWREPFMVQAFLPDVAQGDKRIVLIDGEPAGAINRVPKSGEIRSNLAVGGSAEQTALTPEEKAICARVGPDLKRMGLLFVGIDVIGGKLTEINVTSPTGIVAIDRFNGTDTPALFWEKVEAMRDGR